jgi:ubiquinone/menaquinone biosynthesis C-methylase UbiE
MDRPSVDPRGLRASLRFIRQINLLLGYNRATITHLARFARTWRAGQRIDILDVATGSADLPRAILRWGRRHGFNLRIVAVDRHPQTVCQARLLPEPRLHIVQADALSLPFDAGSFDYVLSSMFLHHLDDERALLHLGSMDRLARRGILVADLLRHRRAYVWTALFTAFGPRMLRHDALLSVARSFTRPQIMRLRDRAQLHYTRYHRHFGHRFVLTGQKLGP